MIKKYISEKGQDAIRNFKYKGGSVSYSYEYVWSPLANFILEKLIPQTWAPNAITVMGIILSIFGCSLLAFQGIGNYVIPWTLILFGTCIFVYQTLDNIDGKQARRSGTSSPLGMLMDHGCDALGVSFLTLGVASLTLVDNNDKIMFTGQMGVLFGFWLSCWAQYHSKGILILGKVNAVDDGIPVVALLGFFTYFIGQGFWLMPLGWGINPQDILVNLIRVSGVIQIFSLIKNAGDNFTKDYRSAFSHIIHMGFISLSIYIVSVYTNWHDKYFFSMYFCMALTMVRDITYMQMCVVAEEKYNQLQSTVIVYSTVFPAYIFIRQYFGISVIPQNLFVYGMLAFFAYKYFHYVICVVIQISDILNIKVFSITKKKTK